MFTVIVPKGNAVNTEPWIILDSKKRNTPPIPLPLDERYYKNSSIARWKNHLN
jgi:hypothetical protein